MKAMKTKTGYTLYCSKSEAEKILIALGAQSEGWLEQVRNLRFLQEANRLTQREHEHLARIERLIEANRPLLNSLEIANGGAR